MHSFTAKVKNCCMRSYASASLLQGFFGFASILKASVSNGMGCNRNLSPGQDSVRGKVMILLFAATTCRLMTSTTP